MSGFACYEFQAVDRRLTSDEVDKMRGLSSRARVNANRAVFIYNYRSFRGNVEELLLNHFDAFLYLSNFGTKEIRFWIPTSLFKAKALCLYEYECAVETENYGDNTIISLYLNDEEGGGWIDEEECLDLLDNILPIREALINGDPRALYLTLLAHKDRIQVMMLSSRMQGEGDYLKSLPVPTNLKELDPAHEALVDFFEVPIKGL